jgi:GT2 family glycosyltransferase
MSVSVIVVSYNTAEKLRRCLGAIDAAHEVIVVDNASSDGSAEMVQTEFPDVRLIANAANVGFGAANNQGAKIATGKWLLYLNSDCYAEPGAIGRLVSGVEAAGAVAGGGRLLNLDGTLQQSVAAELTLWTVFLEQTLLERLFRRLGMGTWRTPTGNGGPVEVPQVMGACLLVRSGLELFDERYFLYCEDTDLCRRLAHHGPIVYVPDAEFTHELGSSSGKAPWLGVARYNLGKETYFAIHHGKLARACCWILNRAGALLRLAMWGVVSLVRPRLRHRAMLFWKVLTARSSELRP